MRPPFLLLCLSILLPVLPAAAGGARTRPVRAQAPPAPGSADLEALVGRPFLAVIRAYGPPSAVRAAEDGRAARMAGQKPLVWTYNRRGDHRLEFLIRADGRVERASVVSRALVVPPPVP